MKKLFSIILTIMMVFNLSFAQTADREHTIQRGETIESIAKMYNVTQQQILDANPLAKDMFYAGMVIKIPQASNTNIASNNNNGNSTNASESRYIPGTSNETTYTEHKTSGLTIPFNIEYGFLSKESGLKGTNYTYAATAGVNYYFMHEASGLFAGARIGYNSANFHSFYHERGVATVTHDKKSHFITLPLYLGYTFANQSESFGVSPYAGFDFNFCVGGKDKISANAGGDKVSQESKLDKSVGIDARIGLQVRLGINIGVAYVIPLNDNQKGYFGKDSYLAVSLGFGF